VAATDFSPLLAKVSARRDLPSAAERRRLRIAAGLSLTDVAVSLKVTRSAVSLWEHDKRYPSGELLVSYARLLDELKQLVG
jgi:transcriptional regulator with XRE-family HTH domain